MENQKRDVQLKRKGSTRPGDILLKRMPTTVAEGSPKESSFLKKFYGWQLKHTAKGPVNYYIHAGLAVGDDMSVEVQGALGKGQSYPSVYEVDLRKIIFPETYYEVWRFFTPWLPIDVAEEAKNFVDQAGKANPKTGMGYGLLSAFRSTDISIFRSHLKQDTYPADKKTSLWDHAVATKGKFFCSEFVVWLYNQVAWREGFTPANQFIGISSSEANPNALGDALIKSEGWSCLGYIDMSLGAEPRVIKFEAPKHREPRQIVYEGTDNIREYGYGEPPRAPAAPPPGLPARPGAPAPPLPLASPGHRYLRTARRQGN
jgi:hypothetical protein